jgi:S1-C subfamily serine protease
MSARSIKNALVVLVGLCLAAIGVSNLVLKATFTLMDDGAFWKQTAQGLVAARLAPGGPAERAGVHIGDVLVAVDGEEALSPSRLEGLLAARRPGERVSYTLLRESERRVL